MKLALIKIHLNVWYIAKHRDKFTIYLILWN